MRRFTLGGTVACLLVLNLAGCVAEPASVPNEVAAETAEAPAAVEASPGNRPNWTHGDWFKYRMYADFGFGPFIANESSQLVVTKAGPEGYVLGPSERSFGVVDAHFNDFYIGPIDPNLNGFVGPENKALTMFQWPLKDKSTWRSTYRETGIDVTEETGMEFTATAQNVADPKGEVPGFRIEGKADSGASMVFSYSPRAKWITELTRVESSGLVSFRMLLLSSGGNYTGPIHQVTKDDLYFRFVLMPPLDPAGTPVPPVDQVQINKDYSFLQEVVVLFTFEVPPAPGGGVSVVEIVYPDQAHREFTHAGTGNTFNINLRYIEPYRKGAYTIDYTALGLCGAFVAYFGFTDVVLEFSAMSHAHHG